VSVQYLANYSRKRGKTIPADWWYVYTAFAPFDDGRTLVKVGISSIPHERMVGIYCSCPFPVRLAAWVAVGRKSFARRIEYRILKHFERYKTRGEWLLLPNDPESKQEFAAESRKLVEIHTKRPAEWTRFTEAQIKDVMAVRLSAKDGTWGDY
jgi:hypothetical protein